MRSQYVETWALRLVDTVLGGADVEDSRVELKSEWPSNHARSARQIAGLANASSGEDVMWIIGVDESSHSLKLVAPTELQGWWLQVSRRFSEVAPELYSLVVAVPQGGSVVVLVFDTSRAPYLVTTDGHGGVEREVPWREGNATRSARRSELLRTIVEQSRVPNLELIGSALLFDLNTERLDARDGTADSMSYVSIYGTAVIFIEAVDNAFMPEHRWSSDLDMGFKRTPLSFTATGPRLAVGTYSAGITRYEPRGSIEYVPGSGLSITGSDAITLRFSGRVEVGAREAIDACEVARLSCIFPIASTGRRATVNYDLFRAPLRAVDSYGIGDHGFKAMTHDGGPTPA